MSLGKKAALKREITRNGLSSLETSKTTESRAIREAAILEKKVSKGKFNYENRLK